MVSPTLLAARATHALFYVVMIGAPLSGWAMVSTDKIKFPTVLFGLVRWPHLPLPAAINESTEVAHSLLGWLLPALIALHVGAALWHHLQKDEVLARMVPAGRNLNAALGVAGLLLAGAAWLGFAGPVPNLWRSAAPAEPMAEPSEAESEAAVAETDSAAAEPSEAASDSADAKAALSPDWAVQGGKLGWSTNWSGSAIQGNFRKWTAQIRFDPDDLANARIAVDVDLASSNSGDSSRDESIQGPQFFNTAAHPHAKFTSSKVSKAGAGYTADGTLSLNGITRPAKLRFTVKIDGDRAVALHFRDRIADRGCFGEHVGDQLQLRRRTKRTDIHRVVGCIAADREHALACIFVTGEHDHSSTRGSHRGCA